MISAKATTPPAEGSASGVDEKQVEAEAWTAACAKLPASAQVACAPGKEPEGWSWSGGGGSSEAGGKKTFSKTITLTARDKQFSGKGTSTDSSEAACKDAYAQACKAAGAQPGCEATAAFVDNGTATSSTTALDPKK